jgi:Rps23 Pro-64 3,4-dihydroxylase Tpa1-like proline 4-hydroxylase
LNLRRFKENLPAIEAVAEQAVKAAARGVFSYSFDRTLADHHPKCECLLCGLQPFFEGGLREFIGTISSSKVGQLREVFAARFTSGCFLAPHVDTHQGRIAFVVNLTKGWRPEYGGLLHLTSQDGQKVTDVVVPSFNSLYLFEIPLGVGQPHFVSHVAPFVTEARLTLTGWFD